MVAGNVAEVGKAAKELPEADGWIPADDCGAVLMELAAVGMTEPPPELVIGTLLDEGAGEDCCGGFTAGKGKSKNCHYLSISH